MMTDEGVRTCDMCDDGETEANSITFSWNGSGWVVDLCDEHVDSFFDAMKPYIDAARVDKDFINNNIEAPEGFYVLPAHRKRNGTVVKPVLKRKTPAQCPVCHRRFVAFNGLGAHMYKTHDPQEIDGVGWFKRMTYDEYLAKWPQANNAVSNISIAGLVQAEAGVVNPRRPVKKKKRR